MSGRPGRSGGANKIDRALHLLKGSYRPGRHAPPPAPDPAALAPMPGPPAWAPTPAQLAALGPDGQALVAQIVAAYTIGLVEGPLLLEAAHASDRLAEVRQARAGADSVIRLRLGRAEAQWQRQLSALLQVIRVDH